MNTLNGKKVREIIMRFIVPTEFQEAIKEQFGEVEWTNFFGDDADGYPIYAFHHKKATYIVKKSWGKINARFAMGELDYLPEEKRCTAEEIMLERKEMIEEHNAFARELKQKEREYSKALEARASSRRSNYRYQSWYDNDYDCRSESRRDIDRRLEASYSEMRRGHEDQ